jgi:hypothetical protein
MGSRVYPASGASSPSPLISGARFGENRCACRKRLCTRWHRFAEERFNHVNPEEVRAGPS